MRVTALIGAGANLAFDFVPKPSTYNLTKKIVWYRYYFYDTNNNKRKSSTLVKRIYTFLCRHYSEGVLNPAESYGKIHFEILFHVLENLYSYGILWKSTERVLDKFVPPLAYLTSYKIRFSEEELRQVMKQFITILLKEVNGYDVYFKKEMIRKEKWYTDLWTLSSFKWDIFNLNYDTTIESCLQTYDDGYKKIKKHHFSQFHPLRFLNSRRHTINHLHGCILYGTDRLTLEEKNNDNVYNYDYQDWYLWEDFSKALDNWEGTGRSTFSMQNHETIFPSPIITGLNKTEKITAMPFDTYRYNLNKRLMSSNAILIAGYSFGDYYINLELERMRLYHGEKFRVVLIDYWKIGDYEDEEGEIVRLHDYIAAEKVEENQCYFIEKAMHIPNLDYYRYFQTLRQTKPFVSENKQVMLIIGGIKTACNFREDIYQFLMS